jgi:hypothetical protein
MQEISALEWEELYSTPEMGIDLAKLQAQGWKVFSQFLIVGKYSGAQVLEQTWKQGENVIRVQLIPPLSGSKLEIFNVSKG